jgi:hypothetical protein
MRSTSQMKEVDKLQGIQIRAVREQALDRLRPGGRGGDGIGEEKETSEYQKNHEHRGGCAPVRAGKGFQRFRRI